jgi:hypothetical protein
VVVVVVVVCVVVGVWGVVVVGVVVFTPAPVPAPVPGCCVCLCGGWVKASGRDGVAAGVEAVVGVVMGGVVVAGNGGGDVDVGGRSGVCGCAMATVAVGCSPGLVESAA